MIGKYGADVVRYGAQVLANHQTVRARGFDGKDRYHRLVIVRNIRTALRAFALRNPPQAEQAQHMVDAYRTCTREHVVHHVAIYAVTGFFQIIRIERRLAPILTLLVVEVGRATYGHATDGKTFRIPPHVGAQCVHAHGHILH